MCKRMLVCITVLLLVSATSFAAIGQFDATDDIGFPHSSQPYVHPGVVTYDAVEGDYHITAGGSDIWGNYDQFTYLYKSVTGNMRMTANYTWIDRGVNPNDWGKAEAMLRYTLDPGSQHRSSALRAPHDWIGVQQRDSAGGGSGGWGDIWSAMPRPTGLGIERIKYGSVDLISPLYNRGAGWQKFGMNIRTGVPDTVYFGAAITSHGNDRWNLATVKVEDVVFADPLLSYPRVPKDAVTCVPDPTPGFRVRALFVDDATGWGYDKMNALLDGLVPGHTTDVPTSRVVPYINFHDSEGRGNFELANGYPDMAFPGIDPLEDPDFGTDNPNGDADDNFALEAIACIHLTAGPHLFEINSDDGAIVKIGGYEVGRTTEWKGAGNEYILFSVEAEGNYPLQLRWLEGGGGAELELHYILGDGTRILLGDPRGPAVYVPEPATIALLGLGGLSLLGSRRKH